MSRQTRMRIGFLTITVALAAAGTLAAVVTSGVDSTAALLVEDQTAEADQGDRGDREDDCDPRPYKSGDDCADITNPTVVSGRTCSVSTSVPCLTDADCPGAETCQTGNIVYLTGDIMLATRIGQCGVSTTGCEYDDECPEGLCETTTQGCHSDADCDEGICSTSGLPCHTTADCSSTNGSDICEGGRVCIGGETCDDLPCSISPQRRCTTDPPGGEPPTGFGCVPGGDDCEAPRVCVHGDRGWWEGFVLDDCSNLAVSFCCPGPQWAYGYLYTPESCAECETAYANDLTDFGLCDDSHRTFYYYGLPPGTYYQPIYAAGDPGPDTSYQLRLDAWAARGVCCTGPSMDTCTSGMPPCTCEAIGGAYLGDGGVCTPNPCLQPGACCLTNGIGCVEVTGDTCISTYGGYFAGPMSSCVEACCEVPATGADDCKNTIPKTMPVPAYATYYGNSSTATYDCTPSSDPGPGDEAWYETFVLEECAEVLIDYCCTPSPYGAPWFAVLEDMPGEDCCTDFYSIYPDEVSVAFSGGTLPPCADGNPVRLLWYELTPGTYHYAIQAGPPTGLRGEYFMHVTTIPLDPTELGACCVPGPGGVECVPNTCLRWCTELGGTWLGGETDCGPPDPCLQVGACCYGPELDVCTVGLTPGECDAMSGVYLDEGTNCGPPDPCELWACCRNGGADCTVENRFSCDDPGAYLGYLDHCLGDLNGNGIDDVCEDACTLGGPDTCYGDGSTPAGECDISADRVLTNGLNCVDLHVHENVVLDTAGYIVRVCRTLLNEGTITDTHSGGGSGPTDGGRGQDPCEDSGGPPQAEDGLCVCLSWAPDPDSLAGGGGGCGGSGAGGGGAKWLTPCGDADGGDGGDGGRGGRGGGWVRVYAYNLDNQGLIHADGEDGQPGEPGSRGGYWYIGRCRDLAGGGGGGGAGGSGGDGGTVEIYYADPSSNLGTIQADAGLGGAGGDAGTSGGCCVCLDAPAYETSGLGGSGCPLSGDGGDGAWEQGTCAQAGEPGGAGLDGAPGQVSSFGPEACCLGDGTCDDVDPFCCADLTGTSQGPGTMCTAPRACCLADDTCEMLDPLCCVDQGGAPQGPGTTCLGPWACCFDGGTTCRVVDRVCCEYLGGYEGGEDHCLGDANTDGIDDACVVPEACCLQADDTCEMLLPDDCEADPDIGIPQGPGTVCTEPQACCLDGGTTCVEVDPLCCDELGGYLGDGDHCLGDLNTNGIDDACEVGACCEPDGGCTDTAYEDCSPPNLHHPGKLCAEFRCPTWGEDECVNAQTILMARGSAQLQGYNAHATARWGECGTSGSGIICLSTNGIEGWDGSCGMCSTSGVRCQFDEDCPAGTCNPTGESCVRPVMPGGDPFIDPFFSCSWKTASEGLGYPPDIGANTVWYKFVSPEPSISIETCSSGLEDPSLLDTALVLYEGECGNLTELTDPDPDFDGCGEDECPFGSDPHPPYYSQICYCGLSVGSTYYLEVINSGGTPGQYQLDIEYPCPDCLPGACCEFHGKRCFNYWAAYPDPDPVSTVGCETDADCDETIASTCGAPGQCICLPDYTCWDNIWPTACQGANQRYGGDGTQCEPGPLPQIDPPCGLGACCYYNDTCHEGETPFECVGGISVGDSTWLGEASECSDLAMFEDLECPTACPMNAICHPDLVCTPGYGHPYDGESLYLADSTANGICSTSGAPCDGDVDCLGDPDLCLGDNAQTVADSFTPLETPVSELCWRGVYRSEAGDDCSTNLIAGPTSTFTIRFWEDTDCDGLPSDAVGTGGLIAEYVDITPDRSLTGFMLGPRKEWEYHADFANVPLIPEDCYFVEIAATNSPGDCDFWIETSTVGDDVVAVDNDADGIYDARGTEAIDLAWLMDVAVKADDCLPANDDCATVIAATNGLSHGTNESYATVYAGTDGPFHPKDRCGIPGLGNWTIENDIWYTYTAECTGELTVDICTSGYDTMLAVYNFGGGVGTSGGWICPTDETYLVACNNDTFDCGGVGTSGVASQATVNVNQADKILIRVGGYEVNDRGCGLLKLDLAPDGPEPCFEDADCQDGLYCNGTDSCNQSTCQCEHTGDPCAMTGLPCQEEYDGCGYAIVGAQSCQDHVGTEYCLDIGEGGTRTEDNVEPRMQLGAPLELEIIATGNVASNGVTLTVSCTPNPYTGTATVVTDGTNVGRVTFTEVLPNKSCCTLTFSGDIKDCWPIVILEGDVTFDCMVSTADMSSVKARLGVEKDETNFWYDVNRDCSISTADRSNIKARLGDIVSCPCTCP